MDLKDILENFVKYKEQLDDLERNESDYSGVETYEKQFMVRLRNYRVLLTRNSLSIHATSLNVSFNDIFVLCTSYNRQMHWLRCKCVVSDL